eukprot:scaffold165909_cov28-Tisochrysis_lutea.AAC.1
MDISPYDGNEDERRREIRSESLPIPSTLAVCSASVEVVLEGRAESRYSRPRAGGPRVARGDDA